MPARCLQEAAVENRVHVAIAGEQLAAAVFRNRTDDAVDGRAHRLPPLAQPAIELRRPQVQLDALGLEEDQVFERQADRLPTLGAA